jgi:hypothetical protein
MLFLHKGADRAIIHAVYTGEVPKGNEASYDLVTPHDFVRVATNARHVMRALGIRESSHLALMRILFSWIQATAYDLQQATIYTMMSAEGMEARRRAGISANWRYYNNYIDLVLALYGEYLSKTNLIREGLVARLVLASPRIAAQMVSLATKISLHVEITFRAEQRDDCLRGAYQTLHEALTWVEWKSRYAAMSPAVMLPFLYDITMKFKAPLRWTEPTMAGGRITKDNMRMNVSTPNEDFYWTSRARWADLPIWAAPSYTAQLMLLVARNAGATLPEITSFAYVIFAYWNHVYPHTATPVHRMFEVMTTAREFGVPPHFCEPDTMYDAAIVFVRVVRAPVVRQPDRIMSKL